MWKRKPSLPASSSIAPTFSAPTARIGVCATDDGLILYRAGASLDLANPQTHRHSRPPPYRGPATLVKWGNKGEVEQIDGWDEEDAEGDKLTVDGVVGILRGFEGGFLVLCTNSTVAATLFEPAHKVHQVGELATVPLAPSLARPALIKLAHKLAARRKQTFAASSSSSAASSDESDGEEDPETDAGTPLAGRFEFDREPDALLPAPPARSPARPFWQRRFAPRTAVKTKPAEPKMDESDAEGSRPTSPPLETATTALELSSSPAAKPAAATVLAPSAVSDAAANKEFHASRRALDKKIVQELERELLGMYWSPTADISRSMQHKQEQNPASPGPPGGGLTEPLTRLPMWRRVDRRFWWNEHLANIDGLRELTLCLQQGCVRQVTVPLALHDGYTPLDPNDAPASPASLSIELTLISRRSIERAGLRYQRRGVDSNGSVANMCETEFLIKVERDGVQHVASFVQTRGSIPVFWTQSPWALKPPPMLARTPEESHIALAKHFEKQTKLYGKQYIMNLAETQGKEAVVVDAFREQVALLDREDVSWGEFDFHRVCSGMRFERVVQLIDRMEPELEEIGCFWTTSKQVYSTQIGVVRTNCIDCLDRTNVVQSALARRVLNKHLMHLGITTQVEDGQHDQLDMAFNGIWADNGDAISREYAGTSALKGDYVRTGKRDILGALNDANNSVQRMVLSTTTDFFRQAVIEYVLGQNLGVFDDFQQKLEACDPGELLKLANVRKAAVDTAFGEVLTNGETRVDGWTLLGPAEANVVRSPKGRYEEKLLLVSSAAVYCVAYEYSLQKVTAFTRVPLGEVVGLQVGPYFVTATPQAPEDSWGIVLRYKTKQADERQRTYSMSVKKKDGQGAAVPGARSASVSSVVDAVKATTDRVADKVAEAVAATTTATTTASVASTPAWLKPLKSKKAIQADQPILPVPVPPHAPAPAPTTSDPAEAVFAFKALKKDAVRLASDGQSRLTDRKREESSGGARTAQGLVLEIVAVLRGECERLGAVSSGEAGWVEEREIIGFAEARRNVPWQEALSNSVALGLKNLVWG